jgi:hypothetical protein
MFISVPARMMRIAISPRLAARSFLMGVCFFGRSLLAENSRMPAAGHTKNQPHTMTQDVARTAHPAPLRASRSLQHVSSMERNQTRLGSLHVTHRAHAALLRAWQSLRHVGMTQLRCYSAVYSANDSETGPAYAFFEKCTRPGVAAASQRRDDKRTQTKMRLVACTRQTFSRR